MHIDITGPEPEPEALAKAHERLAFWENAHRAEIHVRDRTKDGWLEYLLCLYRADASRIITIGMIQREVGAPYEFHS
jgi:hypothetical protein